MATVPRMALTVWNWQRAQCNRKETDMKTNEKSNRRPPAGWMNRPSLHVAARLAAVCLVAALGSGRAAADAGSPATPAKKPLIWIQIPPWTGDDENWGGPYDGPSARRMCMKILKDEANRLGVELSTDATRIKEFDGVMSLNAQSPPGDMAARGRPLPRPPRVL